MTGEIEKITYPPFHVVETGRKIFREGIENVAVKFQSTLPSYVYGIHLSSLNPTRDTAFWIPVSSISTRGFEIWRDNAKKRDEVVWTTEWDWPEHGRADKS